MKLPSLPRRKLKLEYLEDRTTPATFTVTTPDDIVNGADGLLSLREAIAAAEADAVADVIDFDPALAQGTLDIFDFDTGLDDGEVGPTGFIITTPTDNGVETFTWRAPLAGRGIRSVAATASVGIPEVAAFSTSGFSPCAFVAEDDGLFTDGFEPLPSSIEGTLTLD